MEDIEANDSLQRILTIAERGFRKLQHYGNPDDWGDWAPTSPKTQPTPTNYDKAGITVTLPKYSYRWYRDYYAAKSGQQAPETKRLSPE